MKQESRLTLDNGWIMGYVSIPSGEKIYIEPLGNLQSDAVSGQYVIYSGNAVLKNSSGTCGALQATNRVPKADPQINDPSPSDPNQLASMNCKEVDFSVASAADMINGFHNSPQLVMNHIVSITNMMQPFFDFFPLQYLLNDNYVSTSPGSDPFNGSVGNNTDDLLPGFMNWAQSSGVFSEHDVAQVWTARNITGCGSGSGLVGCAYINAICNNMRYNICEDFAPTNIQGLASLSAHELGHNWNCQHSDAGAPPFNIMNATIQLNAAGFGPNSLAKITNTANSSGCLSDCGGNNLIDLELSMTASVPSPGIYTTTRVTLTLFNNSQNQASNIVSLFNFSPTDYVFAGDGAVSVTGGGTFSIFNGNWSVPSLPGGQTATVSFDIFTLSNSFNPCAQVSSVSESDVDSTPGNGQCPNAVEDDEAQLNSAPPTGGSVDIAVTLGVSNPNPDLYTTISYPLTVQNLGTQTATGLTIDFDFGAQISPASLALVNNPNPDYDHWNGIWNIGTLAAGETKSFSLDLFVLIPAGPTTTLTAELLALNETDSNAGNNSSFATIFVGGGAGTIGEGGSQNSTLEGPVLSIENLFPNPTIDNITLAVNNQIESNLVPLQVFDSYGKVIYNKNVLLEKGMNNLIIETTNLSKGVYLVVMPNGSNQNIVKRFIKM